MSPMTKKSKNPLNLEDKITMFKNKCRREGLRITPQRLSIYKVLLESKEHPSAEMVFKKVRSGLPFISLDTVNRTLLTFSRIGVAFTTPGSGDPKRYDANLESHQHFKCTRCKKLFDFHHNPFDDMPTPSEISKKFTILRKTVYFEGICDKCKNNMK